MQRFNNVVQTKFVRLRIDSCFKGSLFYCKLVSCHYFQVLKREKAKLVLENKENAAKFLDPEEKRRKADYGKNIKGNGS